MLNRIRFKVYELCEVWSRCSKFFQKNAVSIFGNPKPLFAFAFLNPFSLKESCTATSTTSDFSQPNQLLFLPAQG